MREFPGLTKLLVGKVGKELHVRPGPEPNTYVFFRKTSEGTTDLGVCSYDETSGRKTYTGHIPDTTVESQELVKIRPDWTAEYETIPLNFGTGSPVTFVYNTKAQDKPERKVGREDAWSQIPFP